MVIYRLKKEKIMKEKKEKTLVKPTAKQVWTFIFQIFAVAISAAIAGLSFKNFFEGLDIIPTGMSGFALLVKTWIGGKVSTSIIYLILNVILFACAWKFFGWKFLVLSGVGLGAYVLGMEFGYMPFLAGNLESDKLLYTVVGSIISGIAVGLAIRMGGSTGGSDILGTLVNRMFPKIKTGHALLAFNILVLILSIVTTGQLSTGLYALISSIITSSMTNMVLDSSKKIKAFYIICDKPEEISQAIMTHYHRGVTRIDATGMFTGNEKAILLCLVPYDQSYKMREFVLAIDEKAFVFSTPVTETIGQNNLMTAPLASKELQQAVQMAEKQDEIVTQPQDALTKTVEQPKEEKVAIAKKKQTNLSPTKKTGTVVTSKKANETKAKSTSKKSTSKKTTSERSTKNAE